MAQVFRNQTAYSRFWNGREHMATITTSVRNLTRHILVLSPSPPPRRRNSDPPNRPVPNIKLPLPNLLKRTATRSLANLNTLPIHSSELSTLDLELSEKVIETVKILIAMLYATKNHLRTDWGVALSPGAYLTCDGQASSEEEYGDLLPPGLKGYEHRGLALTLELAVFVESFIGMGVRREWFHNAVAGQMQLSLNDFIKAYGEMEVIRLTNVPVAHL